MWFKSILILFLCLVICDCYKILALFSLPGKSHAILGEGYVKTLAAAGHEVTYLAPMPMSDLPKNARQINVTSVMSMLKGDEFNLEKLIKKETDTQDVGWAMHILHGVHKSVLTHENVQKLLLDPSEKFDAVIVEWLYSEIGAGLASLYNCPLIWSSSMDTHWNVLSLIDDPPNPAYSGEILTGIIPPFSFWERMKQLWQRIKTTYNREISMKSLEEEAFKEGYSKAFEKRGRTIPTYDEARYNGSLMLGNSHVSIGDNVRLPQNYKYIGGYHIEENVKPLPEDLQNILDNAKEGAIYFSLGTMLQAHQMTQAMKDGLFSMFGRLKQTVIWKLEGDFPNLPKNVHILKWAPQQSILSHPNIKLFITHGGLLSLTETVHFGVPVIGIPVFADQYTNIERFERKGIGKRVDLSFELHVELEKAIKEILGDPSYTSKVKETSFVYHDRLSSPREELVHWVRHTIETGGAPHLRSLALQLPWYQKLYLDFVLLVSIAMFLLVKLVKIYFRKRNVVENKKNQ